MSRTFFAIPIDKNLLSVIQKPFERLRTELGNSVEWIPPQNWHITLRFLGEINHKQLATLIEAAREIAHDSASGTIQAKILAPFPRSDAKHIALHLHSNAQLKSLADKLSGAAFAVGVSKDTRRFRPHITLGKIRYATHPFSPLVLEHFDIPFTELVLYESKFQPNGSDYRKLQVFQLDQRGNVHE